MMTARFGAMLAYVFVAACGWAQLETPLVVWGSSFGPDTKGFEAVVREFERRHPGVRVRALSMGAGAMNPQKLMTSIVGGVAPDVIRQDRFTIGDWASRGAFRPLDDFLARDAASDPDCPKPEDYYASAWEEACYQGRVYAIPIAADNRALYWNRAIFREKARDLRAAGLDPGRAPRTWSELLAYSKALTEFNPDGSIKRAGFLPNFGNSWFYLYAFQTGAEFLSKDGARCTLAGPEAEEALRFMIAGYSVVGGYENATAFQTGFLTGFNDPFSLGKVAMKIDGDWILNGLSRYSPDLDFAVAPPPIPDDRYLGRGRYAGVKDKFITWSGGFSYAIPTGARRPGLAWEFIKWSTSVEGRILESQAQRDWEKRRGRDFIPKQSANIVANEEIYRRFRPSSSKFADALRAHIDLMPASRIRPVTVIGQVLWDEHVRAMERACLGVMTPRQALLAGQRVVQRELDDLAETKRLPILDLRKLAWLGLAALALGAALLIWGFRRLRLGPLARSEARWAYLFISPWALGFLIFVLGPMLASIAFSFTRYNVLSEARWTGLDNYLALFTSDGPNVSKAFANVLYLVAVGVPLNVVTGLAIALLLNGTASGMRFYRTIFYMPAIVPSVASAVLWLWLLASDPNKGLLNAAWQSTISTWFGTPVPGWISSEAWSKPALVLMGAWGAGGGMVLWLAGLKGVPRQLMEAAAIDGATQWRQFWSITLPTLSPVVFFNVVMGVITAMQEFDRIYVMRTPEGNPGPNDSLLVPVYHLFTHAFTYFKMGYASALAWLIFAIILGLTLVQFKLAPRWVHYEAET